MKMNEVAGTGNHNTAQFWEYDTRTARRWNLDPKPNSWESYYSILANSPINHKDVLGDRWLTKKDENTANKLSQDYKAKEDEYNDKASKNRKYLQNAKDANNKDDIALYSARVSENEAGAQSMRDGQRELDRQSIIQVKVQKMAFVDLKL
jgi:hypothetical protein